MIKSENVFLTLFCAAVVAAGAGCDDSGGAGGAAGNSGTGGSGAGTGGTTSTGMAVPIVPDATGWVQADTNTVGVQGAWYGYGDGADGAGAPMGTCQKAGHMTAACSVITAPLPGKFENVGGKMCTSGTVGKVIDNPTTKMPDYGNIWGAGIGLDLNNSGGVNAVKDEFNATAKGVTGISFDIDTPPLAGLRVEFPSKATEAGSAGGDYWGADANYKNSPVTAGTNKITWDLVKGPGPVATAHVFDAAHILSIQFHVPTTLTGSASYAFCISNLQMLK